MSGVMEDMDGLTLLEVAEHWYARLMAPDCSAHERKQFDTWIARAPEHALAFEETKALWESFGALEQDEVLAAHVAEALEPDADTRMAQWVVAAHAAPRARRAVARRRWLPLGAGIAAALALGLLLRLAWPEQVPAVAYAAVDRIESLSLADGSSVRLDKGATMAVRIGKARRDIELQQGRAVFDVARDPDRPFVVDAGVGTITALGTQFQVQREGENVSVILVEGSVGIDATEHGGGARSIHLVPGQRADYAPATHSWTIGMVDASAATSWSQGFHVFGATPLAQALVEINRYSDVELSLADPAVGKLQVSGSFKLGDGRAIAEALPYALPVEVAERDGRIVISRR